MSEAPKNPTDPTTSPVPPSNASESTSSKQYVAPSVDDDRLEPDSMRGSEQYLTNVKGLENLEQKRIEAQQKAQKRPEQQSA